MSGLAGIPVSLLSFSKMQGPRPVILTSRDVVDWVGNPYQGPRFPGDSFFSYRSLGWGLSVISLIPWLGLEVVPPTVVPSWGLLSAVWPHGVCLCDSLSVVN